MEQAKYLTCFGTPGWVAFKHGKLLRTRDHRIKIFATEAEALKAAKKSRIYSAPKRLDKLLLS